MKWLINTLIGLVPTGWVLNLGEEQRSKKGGLSMAMGPIHICVVMVTKGPFVSAPVECLRKI